ncbi:hypothetical protein SCHPADRAFT_929359 [Schizopora paradoxa]|uniref:Uncharacterized protein n=1 Tax=Schizopora paradoxa TaxID=27342 RepID=A0A0H2RS54_9AGAM|nr:hypothetical protein SCHPADRAFT_929359 [Schizopora paradoxa]
MNDRHGNLRCNSRRQNSLELHDNPPSEKTSHHFIPVRVFDIRPPCGAEPVCLACMGIYWIFEDDDVHLVNGIKRKSMPPTHPPFKRIAKNAPSGTEASVQHLKDVSAISTQRDIVSRFIQSDAFSASTHLLFAFNLEYRRSHMSSTRVRMEIDAFVGGCLRHFVTSMSWKNAELPRAFATSRQRREKVVMKGRSSASQTSREDEDSGYEIGALLSAMIERLGDVSECRFLSKGSKLGQVADGVVKDHSSTSNFCKAAMNTDGDVRRNISIIVSRGAQQACGFARILDKMSRSSQIKVAIDTTRLSSQDDTFVLHPVGSSITRSRPGVVPSDTLTYNMSTPDIDTFRQTFEAKFEELYTAQGQLAELDDAFCESLFRSISSESEDANVEDELTASSFGTSVPRPYETDIILSSGAKQLISLTIMDKKLRFVAHTEGVEKDSS